MKTEEKDIVNVEAFAVIRRDFLSSMDTTKDKMNEVFGIGSFDPDKTFEFIHKVYKEGDNYGQAIKKILEHSTNMNEYTHLIYLFINFVNEYSNKPMGIVMGRMPKDEDISESLRRVDEFLSKLFKDMRDERDV